MTEQLQVSTEGNPRGAWYKTPEGLLSLVVGSNGQPTHVGCHLGDPNKTHALPYAMSFDEDGDLMLQLPNQSNPHEPLIVPMSYVSAILFAVKGIKP